MRKFRTAYYAIEKATAAYLLIRDLGPWDMYMTVTNAVESTVEELIDGGHLKPGMRLLYFDSHGKMDEILWTAERGWIGFSLLPEGFDPSKLETSHVV